jgi:hypothetical protein
VRPGVDEDIRRHVDVMIQFERDPIFCRGSSYRGL